jgi:hypothetical protein
MAFSTKMEAKKPETVDYVEALNHHNLHEVLGNMARILFSCVLDKCEFCCCFRSSCIQYRDKGLQNKGVVKAVSWHIFLS